MQYNFSPAVSMRIPQNLGDHIIQDQVGTVFVTEKGAADKYIGIIAETRTLWGKVGHMVILPQAVLQFGGRILQVLW